MFGQCLGHAWDPPTHSHTHFPATTLVWQVRSLEHQQGGLLDDKAAYQARAQAAEERAKDLLSARDAALVERARSHEQLSVSLSSGRQVEEHRLPSYTCRYSYHYHSPCNDV